MFVLVAAKEQNKLTACVTYIKKKFFASNSNEAYGQKFTRNITKQTKILRQIQRRKKKLKLKFKFTFLFFIN